MATLIYRMGPIWWSTQNLVTFDVNATTSGMATIFQCPKTGTIDRIGVNIPSAVTGTPTYDLRIETVTARAPTNTLKTTGSNVSYSPTGTPGFSWRTLGTGASVTEGDWVAAVIRCTTGDGSNHAVFNQYLNGIAFFGSPYTLTMTSSSWGTPSTKQPCLAARYTDGTVIPGILACSTFTYDTAINSGTTPDEIGTYWVATANSKCSGAYIQMAVLGDTSTFNVILYEDNTAIKTVTTIDPTMFSNSFTGLGMSVNWPAVSLGKGKIYRLVVKPTTTNSIRLNQATFPDTDSLFAVNGDAYATERTDAGSWTDTNTKTVSIIPILSEISSGTLFIKNTAYTGYEFPMIQSSDHYTLKTGATVTATRSIDGAAFDAGTIANVAEISGNPGIYKLDFGAGDLNGDCILLKVAATDCDTKVFRLMTSVPKASTAWSNFTFPVYTTDHYTLATGKTLLEERSIDGAAFADCTNSASEIAGTTPGCYKIDLSTTDLAGKNIMLRFSASGCDTQLIQLFTEQ